MLTIQEVGTEILTHNPRKLYIMVGQEYGVKMKYVDILAEYYGKKEEMSSMSDVINIMNTKHIIPLQPAVYIVRYDESFISSLSDKVIRTIENLKVIGTIICIYDQDKYVSKLDKYLSKYVVSIDAISDIFMSKYLKADFPNLTSECITSIVDIATDYGQAKNMARCLNMLDKTDVSKLDKSDISELFGYQTQFNADKLKLGIAARDFKYLSDKLDMYVGDYDSILYDIMATMLELDKLLDNGRVNSDFKPYVSGWNRYDVYMMFVHAYDLLKLNRSGKVSDLKSAILYLFSLLRVSPIPSTGELQ